MPSDVVLREVINKKIALKKKESAKNDVVSVSN